MSIYGGKITTSRKLAEHALEKLQPFLDFPAKAWTREKHLPGGDIEGADFEAFKGRMGARYPWLEPDSLHRLARRYGTQMQDVIGKASSVTDMGRMFYRGLSEREVRYLIVNEFVTRPEDILWRRTKLGLHMPEDQRRAFIEWFNANMLSYIPELKLT